MTTLSCIPSKIFVCKKYPWKTSPDSGPQILHILWMNQKWPNSVGICHALLLNNIGITNERLKVMNSATEDGTVVYESMHTLYHQQTNTVPHCVNVYVYLCHGGSCDRYICQRAEYIQMKCETCSHIHNRIVLGGYPIFAFKPSLDECYQLGCWADAEWVLLYYISWHRIFFCSSSPLRFSEPFGRLKW